MSHTRNELLKAYKEGIQKVWVTNFGPKAWRARASLALAEGSGATVNSFIVFHWPQLGQRPTHLGDSCPHSEQTYTVLFLAMSVVDKLTGSYFALSSKHGRQQQLARQHFSHSFQCIAHLHQFGPDVAQPVDHIECLHFPLLVFA